MFSGSTRPPEAELDWESVRNWQLSDVFSRAEDVVYHLQPDSALPAEMAWLTRCGPGRLTEQRRRQGIVFVGEARRYHQRFLSMCWHHPIEPAA